MAHAAQTAAIMLCKMTAVHTNQLLSSCRPHALVAPRFAAMRRANMCCIALMADRPSIVASHAQMTFMRSFQACYVCLCSLQRGCNARYGLRNHLRARTSASACAQFARLDVHAGSVPEDSSHQCAPLRMHAHECMCPHVEQQQLGSCGAPAAGQHYRLVGASSCAAAQGLPASHGCMYSEAISAAKAPVLCLCLQASLRVACADQASRDFRSSGARRDRQYLCVYSD